MLAAKAGLPNYKCSAVIRNRFERKKLDGQECPECKAVSVIIMLHVHIHVGSSFFLGKVTALGVLCCFALFV